MSFDLGSSKHKSVSYQKVLPGAKLRRFEPLSQSLEKQPNLMCHSVSPSGAHKIPSDFSVETLKPANR